MKKIKCAVGFVCLFFCFWGGGGKFKFTKQKNILYMFISVKFEKKNTLNDFWGKHIVLNSNLQKGRILKSRRNLMIKKINIYK